MYHASDYPDAIKCIKNRRYTPAAGFMAEGIVAKITHRVPAGQSVNMTRTIARKLRKAHANLLLAQSGGVALQAMAEQAYQDVRGEMTGALPGSTAA